jgi:glycosyltransferase involved in cell wall biosynthesis
MALEVPVVATAVAGIPRLIQHDANGLLIEPGAIEPLTQALVRLVQDEDLRRRFRQAGRQTIETRYSFASRMKKIETIYDDLLGHKRPPGNR